ncbi:hypothetical protein LSTR_LSTR004903 [Laodelphax striatellus]|uniref:TATA box-binding protein-associated factor RNA polymerase I subunit B n=1 Tax=Laodelphax striatellus TaxID=195883 RepID=A0A482XNL0_LAOST|nr:hypothetical protein LSTR_LSTR004903 [Laodelphax striatellus]
MGVCSTCGSSEFYTNDGFYFCSRCQTQLEGDQEVIFEEGTVSQGKKVRDQKKDISKNESEYLTSWEVYNYTLKFLVDRMIDLGASKDLKPIVLQLWATYLSRLEIAFCSSDDALHVNLSTKKRDVKILTGKIGKKPDNKRSASFFATKIYKKKRSAKKYKSTFSGKLDESAPDSNRVRSGHFTKFKRKIAAAEYSMSQEIMQESSQILSQTQTLESIGDNKSANDSPRLIMNKPSKLFWKTMKTAMSGKKRAEKKEILLKVIRSLEKTCQNVSLASVWALLQLGMILSRQKATLSDTIRWNLEGHVSHRQVIELLPPDVQGEYLNKLLRNRRLTHLGLKLTMARIANYISITYFPPTNFNELIARYMKELNLPGSLMNKVRILFLLCKPKEFFNDKELAFDCELITMAYIIIILKLFLGLNGKTEFNLSKLSNHLNRKTGQGGKKYFSWTEWTRYIECRKYVVADYHYPTRITHFPNQKFVQSDKNSFLNFVREKKIVACKKREATEWENHVTQALEEMGAPDTSSRKFQPSLTPLTSYVNLILDDTSCQLSTQATNLLSENFTEHNLILPDMYARLSKSHKLSINVNRASLRPIRISNFESMTDDPVPHSFENLKVEALIVDDQNTNLATLKSPVTSEEKTSSPNKRLVMSPKTPKSSVSKKRKRRSSVSIHDINVSKIAENLLKKRLIEVAKEKDSNNDVDSRANNGHEESKVESFTVDNPYAHYWVMHFKESITKDDFKNLSRQLFPVTFYWLLHECSNMISVSADDLYSYIMKVEKNVHSKLNLAK